MGETLREDKKLFQLIDYGCAKAGIIGTDSDRMDKHVELMYKLILQIIEKEYVRKDPV